LGPLRGGPEQAGRAIGESWEFSTLEGSESRALGQPLSAVLGRGLAFLAKLIDTRLALSIQVHPTDDATRGVAGKEEAWIVLDADPGAHVLAGVRDGIDAAELARRTRTAIEDPDRGEDLIAALERVEVSAGTVVLVPAGTVHAIGGGILLAEIQQPSDCTYRLFDYGSGRPLHLDDALEAMRIGAHPRVWRPEDAAEPITGVHLDLRPCPAGRHTIDASEVDALVVVVSGNGELVDDERHALSPGDLRLCTGGSFELTVLDDGLAVVGTLPRPFVS
jgi:mannose-6-phosphate isomerase